MASTPFSQAVPSSYPPRTFEEVVPHQTAKSILSFKKVTHRYALFHIFFFVIACLELCAFALFFSVLTQSTLLAFSLAGIVMTAFTYFVLLFYLQAKKPEQLLEIRKEFLEHCQNQSPFERGTLDYHLSLKQALGYFFNQLQHKEYTYYSLPSLFKTLALLARKFSVWCHWKDRHQMQEFILLMMIKEQIEMIKIAPTDLEIHSGLAHSYSLLATHYQDPQKAFPHIDHLWISPEYHAPEMRQKFKKAAWKAIEEYKILDVYIPQDPWVHTQLAGVFHQLEMPNEEICAYETVLHVTPEEEGILFRLGTLYFEAGRNAEALKIYEKLKFFSQEKAQELLSHWSSDL